MTSDPNLAFDVAFAEAEAAPFEDPPADPDNLYFQTEGDPLAGWCRIIRACDDGNPGRAYYKIRFPSPEWEEIPGDHHAIRRVPK